MGPRRTVWRWRFRKPGLGRWDGGGSSSASPGLGAAKAPALQRVRFGRVQPGAAQGRRGGRGGRGGLRRTRPSRRASRCTACAAVRDCRSLQLTVRSELPARRSRVCLREVVAAGPALTRGPVRVGIRVSAGEGTRVPGGPQSTHVSASVTTRAQARGGVHGTWTERRLGVQSWSSAWVQTPAFPGGCVISARSFHGQSLPQRPGSGVSAGPPPRAASTESS